MRETKIMAGLCASVAFAGSAHAGMTNVTVTIENLAPQFGTYQTPFWVGFHGGGFDLYNMGEAASAGLERLAEDGDASFLSTDFLGSGLGTLDGVIAAGGPFAPGSVGSASFALDGSNPLSRYFSYASMVIPSNDAFIANGDPFAHQIFDGDGNFVGADFFIMGSAVLDAGTEVNDELPDSTAFFGQMAADTGTTEGGVVHSHLGFLGSSANPGTPSILAASDFAGADFTISGYPIARVTIVPAPGALAMFGLAGLARRRRRRTA